ncbi:MAG: DNA primase [Dehalococcoidia bacterium]|nr:MAG: DNA primase [Dehalococcoidia bacterium]
MSTIDEIKQRLDVVDVVDSYLRLEKAGRNFKALCPFHQEKTPSFFVFPERQSWRCFGCGSGGDLVSFVMKKEGVDFSEALKMLAERAGVSLARRKETAKDKAADRLYQINEAAAQYYHDVLLKEPIAEPARDYVKGRGLDQKTVADFQLGFSPGEGLKEHLTKLGYAEKELLALGLLGEREGRTYDYFRHRLMFPIRDIRGKVVGFGARALDDSLPKYLNSPLTEVFDKSGVLYGIDRAKGAIRERKLAVIVEGYTDVITAHQHGAANVVASMGTALTEKQIKILRGLTRSLAFALDPDVAGDAATMRGIEVARRSLDRQNVELPGLLGARSKLRAEIKIMPLPRGKDPDAVIREDPQEWQRLVDEALPLMDHLITVVASKVDLTRPEGKSLASEQLLPLIAELGDETQREFYLGKLAGLLGVRDKVLLDKAARLHRSPREEVDKVESRHLAASSSRDPLEEYCLALMLQHPELREKAEKLLPEHFERSENREVFTTWRDASNADELSQMIIIDLQGHLEALCGRALPPAGEMEREKALADCIRRLEERRLRLQEEFITSEDVPKVSAGDLDSESVAAIQQRIVEVDTRMVETMKERAETSFSYREDQ